MGGEVDQKIQQIYIPTNIIIYIIEIIYILNSILVFWETGMFWISECS